MERSVVLFWDLKVARLGIELVDDLGVGGADDAVRAEDLEVLVDWHFLRQKVVLDEDDGDAAFAAGVDHAPHGGEQALGVERIRQGRVALEEAFEQVDDDDRAPRAHGRPPQRMMREERISRSAEQCKMNDAAGSYLPASQAATLPRRLHVQRVPLSHCSLDNWLARSRTPCCKAVPPTGDANEGRSSSFSAPPTTTAPRVT